MSTTLITFGSGSICSSEVIRRTVSLNPVTEHAREMMAGSPYTMGMKDRSSAMLWMAWTVISGPIPAGSPSVIPRSGVFGMVLLSFIV